MAVAGLTTTYSYEAHGDQSGQTVAVGGGDIYRSAIDYGRLARRVREEVEIDGVIEARNYTYDAKGRLAEVRDDAGTLLYQYAYDGRDNRSSVLGVAPGSIVFDAQDQLVAQGGLAFSYDLRGNLASLTDALGTTTLTYDAASSLRRVEGPTGTIVDYVNDPTGARISRSVDGVRTDSYVSVPGGRLLAHTNELTGVLTRFIYAELPTTPTAFDRGGIRYAIVSDARGSARRVVRLTDGVVMQQIDYDPYGVVTSDSSPGFQPFGFAGGLYDPVVGLVRFGARTYDPQTGRFLQRDPQGFPDGPNRYAYVAGDPVNRIDPSGRFLDWISNKWADRVANVGGALGDYATFGLTKRLRRKLGVEDAVNPCSSAYRFATYAALGLTATAIVRGVVRYGLRRLRPCRSSFAAGTSVATPSGDQPIETLSVGDEVLCKSAETGLETTCRIAETFSRIAPQTLELTLVDDRGLAETIVTTAEHPFFTGRFTAAAHLRPGDTVLASGDRNLTVQSTTWSQGARVYNFEVEGNHTYFVGEARGWVHNCPVSGLTKLGNQNVRALRGWAKSRG